MQLQRSTPPDGHLRPAAAYGRESHLDQGQYSPELQQAGATEVLARHGYYVAMWRYDAKEGDRISRTGYQEIREAAQQGLIEAVGVYKMSRWGRNAAERLRIGEELDRLKVPVYDAQRGKADTPGLERVIFAGMDEQFLRDLSWTIVRAMPAAAKDGKHLGPTPVGYRRVYPAGEAIGKHVCADLVPDPVYAPLVVQIFERYADGESLQRMTQWLNSLAEYPNPKSKRGVWNVISVGAMLHRRVYVGEVEWGKRHSGKYNEYAGRVIRSGEDGAAPARHTAIIERPLWDRVQDRLAVMSSGAQRTVTQRGTAPALLSGFLRCAACGGPMTGFRDVRRRQGQGPYRCDQGRLGQVSCPESSISRAVADAAVLAEVARLQGKPWRPDLLERAVVTDPHAAERRRLAADLAAAERAMQANVVAFRTLGDLSDAAVTAFRADAQALDGQIKALTAKLDALPPADMPDAAHMQRIHDEVRRTDMAQAIAAAHADGDVVALRMILGSTITSARIVERIASGPSGRARAARAGVTWTPEVQLLLDAGLLVVGAPPEPPARLSARERAAERARRYRARKREQRAG